MKKDTHPQYNEEAQVTCACGNKIKIGSTKEKIEVEICSNCHPFYTGDEQLIDTAGRAEKFEQRRKNAQKSAGSKKKDKKESEDKEKKGKKSKTAKMVEEANEKLSS